ncbi:MAG: hypothetical protein IPL11_11715 [Candidatus Accumulibacter sp.]|nr:hypothetical protein [Accumulibacter sp.]
MKHGRAGAAGNGIADHLHIGQFGCPLLQGCGDLRVSFDQDYLSRL